VAAGLLMTLLGWIMAMFPGGSPDAHLVHDFPVAGHVEYGRVHHDYPATDIFAGCGRRVVAPVSGTVLEVDRVDSWNPRSDRGGDRGGKHVSIEGLDGVRYYGSHFSRLERDLRAGAHVEAGQLLGHVGHTGSARYTPCHLHFGISPVCRGAQDWWIRRGVITPYRFLRHWQHGRSLSPGGAVAAWQRRHGCPDHP
jgi:murein DD-endopeptidase MepM/ murein hydrolase activator NlpD